MYLCKILFVIVFVTVVRAQYTVPHPKIKVLRPKGFRVSIPDEKGIQLFAFHGNVNEEMEGLDAGQMSKDILKSTKGEWVFEDKNLKLKNGDTVYYWLYVKKDGIGYRLDNQKFVYNGLGFNHNSIILEKLTKNSSNVDSLMEKSTKQFEKSGGPNILLAKLARHPRHAHQHEEDGPNIKDNSSEEIGHQHGSYHRHHHGFEHHHGSFPHHHGSFPHHHGHHGPWQHHGPFHGPHHHHHHHHHSPPHDHHPGCGHHWPDENPTNNDNSSISNEWSDEFPNVYNNDDHNLSGEQVTSKSKTTTPTTMNPLFTHIFTSVQRSTPTTAISAGEGEIDFRLVTVYRNQFPTEVNTI